MERDSKRIKGSKVWMLFKDPLQLFATRANAQVVQDDVSKSV